MSILSKLIILHTSLSKYLSFLPFCLLLIMTIIYKFSFLSAHVFPTRSLRQCHNLKGKISPHVLNHANTEKWRNQTALPEKGGRQKYVRTVTKWFCEPQSMELQLHHPSIAPNLCSFKGICSTFSSSGFHMSYVHRNSEFPPQGAKKTFPLNLRQQQYCCPCV